MTKADECKAAIEACNIIMRWCLAAILAVMFVLVIWR